MYFSGNESTCLGVDIVLSSRAMSMFEAKVFSFEQILHCKKSSLYLCSLEFYRLNLFFHSSSIIIIWLLLVDPTLVILNMFRTTVSILEEASKGTDWVAEISKPYPNYAQQLKELDHHNSNMQKFVLLACIWRSLDTRVFNSKFNL